MAHELLIAVCGRSGARFFASNSAMTKLELVYNLENPDGRKQAHSLVSDKSGESNSSSHQGHNTLAPEHDAVDHESERFAAEVAAYLNGVRKEKYCTAMLVAADAKFTGKLRPHLDAETKKMVRDFVIRDLVKVEERELLAHLK